MAKAQRKQSAHATDADVTTKPRDQSEYAALGAGLAAYTADGMTKFKSRLDDSLKRLMVVDRTASELAATYVLMRQIKDSVEAAFDMISSSVAKMSEEIVPAAFEREDATSISVLGHRVTIGSKYFASIVPEQRKEAYQWLRDHNMGSLIQETVNSSTLSAAAKKEMEEGREMPEDLFRAHFKTNTSLTKVKQ